MALQVGIIGCGRPGRGQARFHAEGYKAAGAQLVAVADIAQENAQAFSAEHAVDARIYTDYHAMLAREKFDMISICTWPHLHCQMVIDAAKSGNVRAIHCEKPVAPSLGEAKRMVKACEKAGVQLTFNHQRRFGEPFQLAKKLLKNGEIGELQRLEGACDNLFDWGTHWFDMFFFYNDEVPAQWVLAQTEWRGSRTIFGVPAEPMGLSQVMFHNGVMGLLVTGQAQKSYGARNRLVGSTGTIEVGVISPQQNGESPILRIINDSSGGWKEIPTRENIHANDSVSHAIADAIGALESGEESLVSARRALQTTEVIMASYESSRRRGRVDLPFDMDESPLLALLREENAVPEGTLIG